MQLHSVLRVIARSDGNASVVTEKGQEGLTREGLLYVIIVVNLIHCD